MIMEEKIQVLLQLNEKFSESLKKCLVADTDAFNAVEIKTRSLAVLGQILSEEVEVLAPHQKEMLPIFDEVFSDIIVSIYLSGCSLDKPAQSVLRRALEIGVAAVFLWDQPCAFWDWKKHDSDLNFNDMLEYLSKSRYKTFLKSLHADYQNEDLTDFKMARNLYRCLSNTTHGKITTFETLLPERFSFNEEDWKYHISLVSQVVDVVVGLWEKRFYNAIPTLHEKLSALTRRY